MRELPSNRLDPKVVNVWRIRAAIASACIAACLIGLALILWAAIPGFSIMWALLALIISLAYAVVDIAVAPSIKFRIWRYAVSEDEIDIVHGWIIRKRSIVPLIRVQHVDTKQGPILRAFGLASVSVATAAGEQEIPGLLLDEADALRDRVAVLARLAQEDI